MAVSIHLQVKGLNELRKKFEQAPRVVGPELEKATKDAGAVLMSASKKESPIKTGALRRSISMSYKPIQVSVYTNQNYAIPVHEGYRAHTIYPVRAGALRFKTKSGKIVYAKRANIPRYKGNPFFRRAVNDAKRRVEEIFANAISRIIKKL